MICIYDQRLPEEIVEKLSASGFFLLPSKNCENLSGALSTHPDIQICKISDKIIVASPEVYDYYKNILEKYGIIVRKGGTVLGDKYPSDSAYNLAANETLAIHNFKITDDEVKKLIKTKELREISINQGYSKCNILFSKTGIITSDMGIYKNLSGVKKLLISPGNISLAGYNYGFIGGASGTFKDTVYFLGDPSLHPDYEEIKNFLEEDETDFKILSKKPLADYGSLIFLQGGKDD